MNVLRSTVGAAAMGAVVFTVATTTAKPPAASPAKLECLSLQVPRASAAGGVASVVGCTFLHDDGSGEDAFGQTGAGTMGMAVAFSTDPQCPTLHAVQVMWGPHSDPQPVTVSVFDDPNDDGDPSDITAANLLATTTGFTQDPGLNLYQTFDIPPIPPESFFDVFYVVAMTEDIGADQFPLLLDTDSSAGESWVLLGVGDTGEPFASSSMVERMDELGHPGNFMLRIEAHPADMPPCPTDTDGNHATDVDDLVTVILQWGSEGPEGDVNGSGIVDVDDLLEVILTWGPCDFDGDDVPDLDDNCPFVANADQANSDVDALGNACDNCWLVTNGDQTDTDLDTLGDPCDNCPEVYNPDQTDENGDATGDECAVFATDLVPRILEPYPGRDLYIPRNTRVALTTELVQAILFVEHFMDAPATNVQASLLVPELPGITVLNNPVSYGDVPSGASSPGIFLIDLDDFPVGLHLLQLEVTSDQASQVLNVWLPVWAIDMTVVDALAGKVAGVVVTPYTTDAITLTAPEVQDPPWVPSFFDIRHEHVDRTLNEPFWGMHWGEAYEELEREDDGSGDGGDGGDGGTANGTVTVHGYVGDSCNNPVAGATVTLTKTSPPPVQSFTATTDANGHFDFVNIPSGTYSRIMTTPFPYSMYHPIYQSPSDADLDYGGFNLAYKVPNVPAGAWPGGVGGPGGRVGPGAAASGGRSTPKSIAVSTGAKIALVLIDAALAPETGFTTLLSAGVAGTGGSVIGVMDDPEDMDIFWACEEHTVPATPGEMTVAETLEMSYTIMQPPIGTTPLIAQSTYTFTRHTDSGASYAWSGGETMEAPVHLHLIAPQALLVGPDQVLVETHVSLPDGIALTGGVPEMVAYVYQDNGPEILGMTVLRDDGQAPDAAPNDGLFTGIVDVMPGYPLPWEAFVWAQRTGFEMDEIPPLQGYQPVPIMPGS